MAIVNFTIQDFFKDQHFKCFRRKFHSSGIVSEDWPILRMFRIFRGAVQFISQLNFFHILRIVSVDSATGWLFRILQAIFQLLIGFTLIS